MKTLVWRSVLLAVSLSVSALRVDADAQDPQPFRETTDYYVLRTAHGFGSGGWSTFAFRRVLQRDDADTVFKDLLEQATLAGQLYALCGLWFTDAAVLEREIEHYRDIEREVPASDESGRRSWCGNTGAYSIGVLAQSPHAEAIRLRGPADSVASWRRRTGLEGKLDIEGGGWPDVLAGRHSRHASSPREVARIARTEEVLSALKEGHVPWREQVPDKHDEARGIYHDALRRHRGAPPPALVAALDDESPYVRRFTLEVLAQCGPRAAGSTTRIAQAVYDRDAGVREAAFEALSCIGPWAGAAWPLFERDLQRVAPSDAADSPLEDVLWHGQSGDKTLARAVQELISNTAPSELPNVRGVLRHPHVTVRIAALDMLRYRPHRSQALFADLAAGFADPVPAFRIQLGHAFRQLVGSAEWEPRSRTVRVLLEAFQNDDSEGVRVAVAAALGALGHAARGALPALERALANPSLSVRAAAACARWHIARGDVRSVPVLLAHLDADSPSPRRTELTSSAKILVELTAARGTAARVGAWLLSDPTGAGRHEVL